MNKEDKLVAQHHNLAIKALKGSVKKWERIVAGVAEDGGSIDCPCCQQYAKGQSTVQLCSQCPIALTTGFRSCDETPYQYRYYDPHRPKDELEFLKGVLEAWKNDPPRYIYGKLEDTNANITVMPIFVPRDAVGFRLDRFGYIEFYDKNAEELQIWINLKYHSEIPKGGFKFESGFYDI